MNKAIIGAGGFAREISHSMNMPDIPFFVDDEYSDRSKNIFGLSDFDPLKYEVVIAIGDPKTRSEMVQKLPKETKYFTYIHPSVIILDENIIIGKGSIICAGTVLTTNIKIGEHCHLNLCSSIGHDCVIGDYFTTAPGVRISGNCNIGNKVYFGTNSCTREKLVLCDDLIIGLNSGVVKDVYHPGTYVGTPAKKIK